MKVTTLTKHLQHAQRTHGGKKGGLDGKSFSASDLFPAQEKINNFIRKNAKTPEGKNPMDGIGYDKTNNKIVYDFGKKGLFSTDFQDKPLDYKFTFRKADPKNVIEQ